MTYQQLLLPRIKAPSPVILRLWISLLHQPHQTSWTLFPFLSPKPLQLTLFLPSSSIWFFGLLIWALRFSDGSLNQGPPLLYAGGSGSWIIGGKTPGLNYLHSHNKRLYISFAVGLRDKSQGNCLSSDGKASVVPGFNCLLGGLTDIRRELKDTRRD